MPPTSGQNLVHLPSIAFRLDKKWVERMPGINMQILLKSEYDDTPLTLSVIGVKSVIAAAGQRWCHRRERWRLAVGCQ